MSRSSDPVPASSGPHSPARTTPRAVVMDAVPACVLLCGFLVAAFSPPLGAMLMFLGAAGLLVQLAARIIKALGR